MDRDSIQITKTINDLQKNQVSTMFATTFSKKFSSVWIFSENVEVVAKVLYKSIDYSKGFMRRIVMEIF
ncbi:hypothetical protein [Alkaliphilus hydrothermalis]|uniref:Uncharacterized protein n=1 Tax=Alkaliphilus hydrothermalis TaxID=1482730 RepID=A0ABS2NNH6_9FIRM|nr:hypothetical protein [Alkaliphilus hydrothermalis]MBM7614498.1 hypothetical protein [Alkaliphilus hydrothermalis]